MSSDLSELLSLVFSSAMHVLDAEVVATRLLRWLQHEWRWQAGTFWLGQLNATCYDRIDISKSCENLIGKAALRSKLNNLGHLLTTERKFHSKRNFPLFYCSVPKRYSWRSSYMRLELPYLMGLGLQVNIIRKGNRKNEISPQNLRLNVERVPRCCAIKTSISRHDPGFVHLS